MILADKMIALRKRAGWSQEELAERMGVSRQSVSKWEGGQSMPDLDKILTLSNLFGVSTDYLLKDEIEEFPAPGVAPETEPHRKRVSMEEASRYLGLRCAAGTETGNRIGTVCAFSGCAAPVSRPFRARDWSFGGLSGRYRNRGASRNGCGGSGDLHFLR